MTLSAKRNGPCARRVSGVPCARASVTIGSCQFCERAGGSYARSAQSQCHSECARRISGVDNHLPRSHRPGLEPVISVPNPSPPPAISTRTVRLRGIDDIIATVRRPTPGGHNRKYGTVLCIELIPPAYTVTTRRRRDDRVVAPATVRLNNTNQGVVAGASEE